MHQRGKVRARAVVFVPLVPSQRPTERESGAAPRRLAIVAMALLIAGGMVGGAAAEPSTKTPPRSDAKSLLQRGPLLFYIAKGEPDACGQGCSEWIAAEGVFAASSAQRMRELLTRLRGRNLPVFFHSPGGLHTEAMAIGRLMRERGMTAGVAKTLPRDCAVGKADDKACRAMKATGKTLAANLRSLDAHCTSACVTALIGAKTRQIVPGARLGVHATRYVMTYRDGRIVEGLTVSAAGQAMLAKRLRSYVRDMGIGDALLRLANDTPHTELRYLSRDEIARFGIDARSFEESVWTFVATASTPAVLKVFAEVRRSQATEFRLSVIHLACAPPEQVRVTYIRGLASYESAAPTSIQLSAAGRDVVFRSPGVVRKLEVIDPGASFESRATVASVQFFTAAASAGRLEIAEGGDAHSPVWRIVSLTTMGLPEALAELQTKCHAAI